MNEEQLLKRKRQVDTLASVFITCVGIGTILSVLAILVVITSEIIPLFKSSDLHLGSTVASKSSPISLGIDPWEQKAYTISPKGLLKEYDLKTGEPMSEITLIANQDQHILSVERGLDGSTTFTLNDGKVQRERIHFKPRYAETDGKRSIILKRTEPIVLEALPQKISRALSRINEDGRLFFARLDVEGKLHLTIVTREENFMGDVETHESTSILPSRRDISHFSANPSGTRVYAFHPSGHLSFWDTRDETPIDENSTIVNIEGRKLTSLEGMLGGEEVALGFSNGDLEVYSITTTSTGKKQPVLIHQTHVGDQAIASIVPSPRNRTLFAVAENGDVVSWYSTSERFLGAFSLATEEASTGPAILGISPRGKGLIGGMGENLRVFNWESEHPEAGFKALFGKVWYSSYQEPDYVWQSSSGSDDFEPKMSLIPLIFGSLKGSLYAMLFSIPFAVFAALYTSVFASPKVKGFIKPTVELMAAIPSVVIGFLAALWLAPLLDKNLLTAAFAIPISAMLLMTLPLIFGNVKGKDLMVLKPGVILFVSVLMILASLGISDVIGSSVEQTWFNGNFRGWLNREIDYDIRNSIIIGIALGFTVIPIIYTISEDALSSVPKGLTSASLALGATPWQTAWRIVLPAASPGIFAAVTLGLGRAVGETMIVLMATGNTAIMDINIFEGFRALSANIAVEIPEAPQGGTLYRVLFLSAGVLLVFTSILNTATEIIRQRLAKTYSRF